jgi:hypothetical protein
MTAMTPRDAALLKEREDDFDNFYTALIPTLVEFMGRMGIEPSREVLKSAVQFAPHLDSALSSITWQSDQERNWLLLRVGQFVGEYFVQKYQGCWYVNTIPDSRYFARYVVGRFARLGSTLPMLDPFQVAQAFVDSPPPRSLRTLLDSVDVELIGSRTPPPLNG